MLARARDKRWVASTARITEEDEKKRKATCDMSIVGRKMEDKEAQRGRTQTEFKNRQVGASEQ